ncbi:hypothetical protein [Bradyrhizobium sp.]|uniref:hypothetical protein n=1 Tax=Bradyrhizobium sp. TaxID=376 RepID=UPI0025BF7941|nr:hypothetical protein [Bradyrhizobium sp.]
MTHFAIALVFLHNFPRGNFGLFSFLLVVSAFSLSFCGAMFAPPISVRGSRPDDMPHAELLSLFKSNLVFSLISASAVAMVMFLCGAGLPLAALFGVYAGVMSLRWFARCWTYAEADPGRVLVSDLAYSVLLAGCVIVLFTMHRLTALSAATVLVLSGIAGLLVLDMRNAGLYFRALRHGRFAPYIAMWRNMSSWAVLGVVLSELTVNAHAYLVTFISGPHAFAVLALGSLLMRPVSLVLAALPDMERPLMARALIGGDTGRALRAVNHFRTAAGAIWLATVALGAALLTWFPHLLLKEDYPFREVAVVVVIWGIIMASRAARTPDSVLLQSAGEFRRLASAGAWSSAVSLTATLLLLLTIGPIAALCGILLGDLVATRMIFVLARRWKAQHA